MGQAGLFEVGRGGLYKSITQRVFEEGRHAVLLQEWHHHGTRIALFTAKSLNTLSLELRECKSPMKSALSQTTQQKVRGERDGTNSTS